MKTIVKEMPLDLFAKEMNALKKPFNVWAFYDAIPGVDFDILLLLILLFIVLQWVILLQAAFLALVTIKTQ